MAKPVVIRRQQGCYFCKVQFTTGLHGDEDMRHCVSCYARIRYYRTKSKAKIKKLIHMEKGFKARYNNPEQTGKKLLIQQISKCYSGHV